jgi:hypothetical protein
LCACLLPFGAVAQPVITQQPASQTTQLGGTATFTVQAGGTSPLVFQWRKNGVNVPGATGSSLILTGVAAEDGGSYTVAISDVAGAIESQPATLTLEDLLFLSLSDTFANRTPLPSLLNLGGTVRGSNASATEEPGEPRHDGKRGGSSVWVSWRSPLLMLAGIASVDTAGSGFDTLLAVYRGDNLGKLTLVASDDDRGGYLNSAIRFNVEPNTEYIIAIDGRAGQQGDITLTWRLEIVSSLLNLLPVITLQPQDLVVANGGSGLLQVGYTSLATPQVQWFHDGVPLPGTTANTLSLQNLTPNQVGEYFAEIRTPTRVVVSRPADVQLSDTNGGGAEAKALDKFYDSTDGFRAAAAGGAGIPRASRSGPRIKKHSVGTASGYTGTQIFSTFGSTREAGEPNHCGVLGGASEWYSYAAPTNGILTIDTDGSDFNTVVAVYIVPAGLPVTFQNLQSVACDDNSGSNNQTSKATFGAGTNDLYYIAVDGVGGAQGTVYLNYRLRVAPFITRQPASKAVTVGGNASFTVEFGGVPPPTCQWQFNGSNLPGATNTSLNLASVQPAASGVYRAVVSNPVGQVTSRGAALTVIGPPLITDQPRSATLLLRSTVYFSVAASGIEPFRYQWYFGSVALSDGGNISGAWSSRLTITGLQRAHAGQYRVRVTNAAGGTDSQWATLIVIGPLQDSINKTAPGGTLSIGPGTYFENLVIDKNITLQGAGVDVTVVDGNNAGRVFEIRNSAVVNIRGLTIRNGYDTAAEPQSGGGGIWNLGSLTLDEVAVVQNCSEFGSGGGILNSGPLTLNRSTVSGNRVVRGEGGGICTLSNTSLALDSCTVSSNKVERQGNGGGISLLSGATLALKNTTLSGNRVNEGNGGGIANSGTVTATSCTIAGNSAFATLSSGKGGGIWNLGTVRSQSTLIAGNQSSVAGTNATPAGHDVLGPLTSEGYNLIGDGTDCTVTPYYGDQIGSTSRPIDPRLGPLQDNGGPTWTHALLPGSPAIDRGATSAPLPVDQRGVPRPKDGDGDGWACSDIGALEMVAVVLSPSRLQNRLSLGRNLPEAEARGDGRNAGHKASFGRDAVLPGIIALRFAGDGSLRLQIRARPGRRCLVQAVSELPPRDWQDVTTCTTDAAGLGEALLEVDSRFPGRFYRVLEK